MLAGLEYKGTFEFYLIIQSVSKNDVKVKFTSNNNNALSIGYFVIIGPANSFDKSTLRKTPSGTATVYQSASITFASVGSLFIPSPGFGWSAGQPRFQIGITQSDGSTTASYQLLTFSTTTVTGIYYYQVWLYNHIMYPMYVKKYRISQIETLSSNYPIKIIFNGQTYINEGKYLQSIPDAIQTIVVQIFWQYLPNKTVQGNLLMCNNCGSVNNYNIKKYFLNQNNMIKFDLTLQQYQTYNVKDCEITLSSTSVLIKQIATVQEDKTVIVNLYYS